MISNKGHYIPLFKQLDILSLLLAIIFTSFTAAIDSDIPNKSTCTLPPAFWCDHPAVTQACTGSPTYCDEYRVNRGGKSIEMKLAFESGCSDSQNFVVNKLYPRVLSKPHLQEVVDFKAVPWGLAKRYSNTVRCHHGRRECSGNRLLTCAQNYFRQQPENSHHVLYCFMQHMMERGDPIPSMRQCLNEIRAPPAAANAIISCSKSAEATELQKLDEQTTSQIFSQNKPFVPYISINGKNHIDMQAMQVILPEKLSHWNKTANLATTSSPKRSANNAQILDVTACHTPPDFWCSDPVITTQCFSAKGCADYKQTVNGRPLEIRVLYNSLLPNSRRYVVDYLRRYFIDYAGPYERKVNVELEPTVPTPQALANCANGSGACKEIALQECITHFVQEKHERAKQLLCLLKLQNPGTFSNLSDLWSKGCLVAQKNAILNCANSRTEWQRLSAQRQRAQLAEMRPEPKRSDPWILINGYSLGTIQQYSEVLHKMICMWYHGPGHKREACSRCEYEPSSC